MRSAAGRGGGGGGGGQGMRNKGVDRPLVGSVAGVVDTEGVWVGSASPRHEVVEDPAPPATENAIPPTRRVRGPRGGATGDVDLPPTN